VGPPPELPTLAIEAPRLDALPAPARRALSAFGHARGVRPVDPVDAPIGLPPIDRSHSSRVEAVEEILHEVRSPLDLGERDAIDEIRARLAEAWATVRAHPEDPEAALLASEVLRALARLEALAGDDLGARTFFARADLLDGGRVLGLSEGDRRPSPGAPSFPVAFAPIASGLSIRVIVDGLAIDTAQATLVGGEHHVRIEEATTGRTLHGSWLPVTGAAKFAPTLAVSIASCSRRDLLRGAEATCARFAVVRAVTGGIEARICAHNREPPLPLARCEPATVFLDTEASRPDRAPHEERSILRSPWTWVAVGAAVIATGAGIAHGLGAFDRPERPPPTWRWEGAR
jgi:hypothetical protein